MNFSIYNLTCHHSGTSSEETLRYDENSPASNVLRNLHIYIIFYISAISYPIASFTSDAYMYYILLPLHIYAVKCNFLNISFLQKNYILRMKNVPYKGLNTISPVTRLLCI